MKFITAFVVRAIELCTQHAWPVIAVSVLLGVLSSWYATTHFAMTTDINQLISANIPWRQREAALEKAFPQFQTTVAVIDAPTPELVDEATDALVARLSQQKDLFHSIVEEKGGPFFARNGLLFESVKDLGPQMKMLTQAQRLVQVLAGDPTLRGVIQVLQFGLLGVQGGQITLDNMTWPMTLAADTIDQVDAGRPASFSWLDMVQGHASAPHDLLRFLEIRAQLDYSELEPGQRASDAIRKAAADLDFASKYQARLRLTGPVPMADEEFATIKENAGLNASVTIAVVLLILWLALRWARIIFAVFVCLAVGLSITAALGLLMVGTLNLISVYFAVLFIGLGVDFGLQFSVRYRAERHANRDLGEALQATARGVAGPLLLAAASIAAAFYSFLPTAYVGLSELGLIAGTGMIVAFLTTITLLPALLSVLKPAGEPAPVGWAALAPLDRFLDRRRNWVVGVTLTAVILGLPLLGSLRFDFNPLDLRSKQVESVSTLLDLMSDPDTSPNTIDILKPDLASASALAEQLGRLKEVAKVRTLESFVPKDQDEKLALIDDASFFFENTLTPDQVDPPPTPTQTLEAINKTSADLLGAAKGLDSPAAMEARRLASALTALAKAPPAEREEADRVLATPLITTLREVRDLLTAEHVTLDTLPPLLKSAWVSADGEVRIEVAPSGDGNDNAVLSRFVDTVRKVAPQASGAPVFIVEAAATIVKAFLEAAVWSVASIALILFVTLRRWVDVALTLVPLMVAILVTLEICVAVGLQLNFANIIALPLLLGVGVAFKIYYVMAWRAGETNFLQSSLTRAVFFSACATATAFGSLWFSHHPGTSSMGKLMALALVTTLSAAVLFQPALLATQRKTHSD